MTRELSLMEFVETVAMIGLAIEAANHEALERCAKLIEKDSKDVIGTYDYGWPQLAPSTQKNRESRGYPANEPLLRTGAMRASIQHSADSKEARVGSNSDIAVYQELGTSKIPPRSFLEETMKRKTPEMLDIIGREVVSAFEKPKP